MTSDRTAPSLAPVDTSMRCRRIVEEALVGIYVSTAAGRLLFCNAAFARLLGFDTVEAALRTPLEALYETPAVRDAFVNRVRSQGRVEAHRARLRRHDGRFVDVLDTVVGEFDADGKLLELRGQVMDITETLAMETALGEREQQFRAVFNDAADAIVILDDARTVVDANPAAERLFGLGPHEVGVRVLDDLLTDRDQLAAAWSELLALGEVKHEHRVAGGARGGRLVECCYRARIHAGRHLCIVRDITDRRLLDERLQQSDRIETVGRLAGGVAHEFNNLLTAMIGYTELLLANRAADDPDRADLEEIQRAGYRAAALTRQLLAFSRKQVLAARDVDLNAALGGFRPMLDRLLRDDVRLTVRTAGEPAVVRIDQNQFEQAIVNLVLNARDALPAGGNIVVSVDRTTGVDGDTRLAAGVPAGGYVRVSVRDTGVGMAPEVLAHVFEPFFTTKEPGKGTGLGLASVHGIVTQSNGHITVESEPGAGTTFAMYFPAVTTGEAERAGGASAGRRQTVLLVEDEDAVRVVVGAVLRRSGYHVLEASTPRGACEIFAAHGSDVDLLLTDVVMPEMNGPTLAQRLIASRPELRVLFISGYADVASSAFSADSPNTAFLGKPFQAAVLVERVREILARPRVTGASPALRDAASRSSGTRDRS